MSPRNLRRAFHATVGIGPKLCARILRFQRAVAHAGVARGRWAAVARETGYFDHAHLIADFRDLARVSPAAFAARDALEPLRLRCG